MIKILIIEDDPYERVGLQDQVSAVYGEENVRVAGNVDTAVEFVNSWTPILILLDIRLKGKSGLEVARYVRKHYPKIQIIIITAYNEFEYAKEALALKINYYLSKPVRPSVLTDTISEALNKNPNNTLSHIIWPLLETGQCYKACSCLDFDVETVLVAGFAKVGENLHEFMNYIYLFLHSDKIKVELIDTRVIVYLALSYKDLIAVLNSLCVSFENKFGCKIILGVGHSGSTLAQLYSRAITACNHKIFYPHMRVLEFDKIERGKEKQHDYPITMEQKLVYLVRRGDSKHIDDMLGQLVSVLVSSSDNNYPVLKTWVESMYNSLKRLCISEGILSNGLYAIKPGIFWFSAKHLEEDFKRSVNRIVRQFEEKIEHPIIAKAVDYMLEHYNEDISLVRLSRKLAISPSYFSRLFKKEVGIPFKNYLISIRMHRAKELLLKVNMAVSEVASEVGYSDPNYFSEAFKKFEGMSPSEYREANAIS